jgi:hypothetical protein
MIDTPKSAELLPCPNPWCHSHRGGPVVRPYVHGYTGGYCRVRCPVCPQIGPDGKTPDQAAAAWNTRATPPSTGSLATESARAFEALERFITDHEGNDDTSDGINVDRRARLAISDLRCVVSAALAVCHSGDDDCTNGRVVTIDPDAFDDLNAALDLVGEGDDYRFTGEEAWDVLVNVDDRTSPEEYPDMCLITRDELIDFMSRTALARTEG